MDELRFGTEGLGRVRFVVSPLWETLLALRILVDAEPRSYHLPWLDAVRPLLTDLDIAPLLAVQPLRGYTPDFLAPLPEPRSGEVRRGGARPSIRSQLEAVRTTPLRQVRVELERAIQERGDAPVPRELRQLAAHPRVARERLADALHECWQHLVEPHWTRLSDLLVADVTHHSRLLAEGGLAALFPALSAQLRWTGRAVQVRPVGQPWRRRAQRVTRLDSRGLVLQPSAFSWPTVQVISDPPWQPALVYPARGIAELWQPVRTVTADALARLLGRTRALLLTSLREPSSTTTLAHRHVLAPATVSEHLSALSDARLVAATRQGRSVVYATTPLGDALLAGHSPPTDAF